MTGDDAARPVLGDVTNRPLKRGFSLISGKFVLKSGDMSAKNLPNEEGDSNLAKQVCLGANNSVKEKSGTPFDTVPNNQTAVVNASRSSSESSGWDVLGDYSEVATTTCEGFVAPLVCDKDLSVGNLAAGGSIESLKLPHSQSDRSIELERCTAHKFAGCGNVSAASDLLKACSCSFCLTATYIWSDLHYQDIKGRIAALKKSQKEACLLVQKNGKGEGIGIHGQANSNQSSRLESDLMGQWKSLFLQMEDMFVCESGQLQASFSALKDLRENCKMDLEKSTGMRPDKNKQASNL